MKTSDLEGKALDWAVGYAQLLEFEGQPITSETQSKIIVKLNLLGVSDYSPSTNWAQGGPIIEREHIALICSNFTQPFDTWTACAEKFTCYIDTSLPGMDGDGYEGPTALIAAMRAYVAKELGDKVEVPDDL